MFTLHGVVEFDTYEDMVESPMPVLDVFTRNGANFDIIQQVYTTGAIKNISAVKVLDTIADITTFINSLVARVGLSGDLVISNAAGNRTIQNVVLLPFTYRIKQVAKESNTTRPLVYLNLPVKVVGASP